MSLLVKGLATKHDHPPEFDPQGPHAKMGEPAFTGWPLASPGVPQYSCTHKRNLKISKTKNSSSPILPVGKPA